VETAVRSTAVPAPAYHEDEVGAVSDTLKFGGRRPPPPRWVWAIAGIAAAAALAGLVVARGGSHGAATSSPSKSPSSATWPVPGSAAPATGSAARWPSAAGGCGTTAYLPQIHLAPHYAGVNATVLVGGAALRQVTVGPAVSRPLPGMPDWQGRLVTELVAGPDAGYALVGRCPGDGFRVYRVVPRAARLLDTTAVDLLGGVHHAWAVTYPPPATWFSGVRSYPGAVLTPLNGGPAVTLQESTYPVADTAAGLVVAHTHPLAPVNAHPPDIVELADPKTGALLRRLAEGSAMGAAGDMLLVSLRDCDAPAAHSRCILESVGLKTGRPTATFGLPAGRVPVSDAVFSSDGTAVAFQLARARQDPRFTTGHPSPPADVAILHLHTGSLDIVPGLELAPKTQAGLAFDATGNWLLATVSEGDRGELLAWRKGMSGPALVTTLPGPLPWAPPLLSPSSRWRTG
jgi:hypothetical protein